MKMLLTALVLGTAALTPAQAQTAARGVTAPKPQAAALAALLVPDDAMTQTGARAFDHGMAETLANDTELKAIYADNPGLQEKVAAPVRAEFMQVMLRALPSLRAELSAIIAADMTPGEIEDTVTFFSSPVGRKLRAQVYQSLGDKPGQDEEEIKKNAMTAVLSDMSADDLPALMAFGSSSAAQKMQVVNPKIAAASKAWGERLVAENQVRMKAMAEKATADYLAGKK